MFLAIYGPWGGPLLFLPYVRLSLNLTASFATIYCKKIPKVGLNIDLNKIYHGRRKFESLYIMMYATECFFYEPDSAVDIFTRLGYERAESRGSNSEGEQKFFSRSIGEYRPYV